ncbi:hypothetical protein [Acinetobacter proteolyticus]|uniref:DUF91 domain-containing protein n=1 Tax=Acinetobacter proteolyticus TaxID=1776741 RepID=A0A2N0WEW9_9GAMM|nr:hypothetical protein [Acinetobacter proteolyticus]PKF33405.1 hypothetical protein CW311_11420 [Acinetobacter proteolyticus]
MAIYTFNEKEIKPVETTTFKNESIYERIHLQQAIKNNISVIAPDCLIISEEYSEWDGSKKRIDLLAIDKNANLVVIELKRTETGDHMELQALRYASMVSTMTLDIAVDNFYRYKKANGFPDFDRDKAFLEISNFVDIDDLDENTFSDDVRVILVSPNFSKELTTSVIWLNERNLDITCIKIQPYTYGEQILLDIQQIIPLPEAKDYQIKVHKKSEERREAKNSSSRDYSKFLFNGNVFNKRNLALEIIKTRFNELELKHFEALCNEFSQYDNLEKLFEKYEEVEEHRKGRYFFDDEHILTMNNGDRYVISNQWGIGNIYKLIEIANNFNYEIIDQSRNKTIRSYSADNYEIEQLEDKTILVKFDGVKIKAYPFLEQLGVKYCVNSFTDSGGRKNTRQLGKEILDKLLELS